MWDEFEDGGDEGEQWKSFDPDFITKCYNKLGLDLLNDLK